MVAIKKVLVVTDFGDSAAVALNYGREITRAYKAQLLVLHIVEDVTMRYNTELAFSMPDLQENLEKAAWRDLNRLITEDDRQTLKVVPLVESAFNIAERITEFARENDIDLIITGTHGRGAVKKLIMGSVAERVVRQAPCPVLTVHAKEREFVAPDAVAAKATA